jgi:aspartyl aminopeptidase
VDLSAYAGASNPTIPLGKRYAFAMMGTINAGAESFKLGYGVRVTPESVGSFAGTGAEAFLQPNVNSLAAASGTTDWHVKAYFNRATNANPETFTNAEVISFDATHAFRLWG